MTDTLKNIKYALLQQENDPLEFCVIPIPLPSKVGIPCFPCELPNDFTLSESNENHQQIGIKKIMDLEEQSSCIERSLFYPSIRPFRMTSRDSSNNIPISAHRPFSCPILKKYHYKRVYIIRYRPHVSVNYEGAYVGRVEEPFLWNFCKCQFHELIIYDKDDIPKYQLKASLRQPGLIAFLPFTQCSKISYQIYDLQQDNELDEESEEQNLNQFNELVGQIDHMFYGWSNELCSKADQYGITFPDEADGGQKALIVMAAVFIDYLWFENF